MADAAASENASGAEADRFSAYTEQSHGWRQRITPVGQQIILRDLDLVQGQSTIMEIGKRLRLTDRHDLADRHQFVCVHRVNQRPGYAVLILRLSFTT